MHSYQTVLTQKPKALDQRKHSEFADFTTEQLENDNDFLKKIIFSDKTLFHLRGEVGKQNFLFCYEDNPGVVHQKLLHPPKLTVCCGFWSGGINGSHFSRNKAGNTVTGNEERYSTKLQEVVHIDHFWFQQDLAIFFHTANVPSELLGEKFED